MRANEFITEADASLELAKKLPTLSKHTYDTIDKLMMKIARARDISGDELHRQFVKRYGTTPDHWIKRKLKKKRVDEGALRDSVLDSGDFEHNPLMQEFIEWACGRLGISNPPQFEWSTDTQDAQDNHHTGRHVQGTDVCWVYVKNRNMVDIMRTVFHELVHHRQGELGMLRKGVSYPGSPVEAMADMLAGKYIKIFGEQHHEIFQ